MRIKSAIAGLVLAAVALSAYPQSADLNRKIPVDPTIRIGKLSNGLTYYLKQNAKPEKRLILRLAVNAGSINETDSEQGLAHFMEHMCFNGTKSWSKNEMIDMLEKMGVRFGDGVNAYTSYNQTIYMLEVPVDDPANIATGYQVLEEWSHDVTLDDNEIEKERGVILEERRLGLGADERMRMQYEPVILKGSRYAERYVIGKEEIIRNFLPDTLRYFYHRWYRPDNMALIVVGDVSEKELVKQLNAHFKKIPKAKGRLNHVEYGIPDNKDPLVSIVTDKEATGFSAQIFFKHPSFDVENVGDYRRKIVEQLYTTLFSKRLTEIGMKPETPYISAYAYIGSFYSRLVDAYSISLNAKENRISESLDLVMTENERVRQFGFTQTELDREKKSILTNLENAVKEADKEESSTWASRCINNYLDKGLLMNPQQNEEIVRSLLPGITLDDVNQMARQLITRTNIAGVIIAPDKAGAVVPTEKEIDGIIESTRQKKLEPYVDKQSDQPLLSEKPAAGKVVKRVDNVENGYTELTFSNGATAVLKSTDFKNDQIIYTSYSLGGLSLVSDQDYLTGQLAANIIQQGGLGDFDLVSLRKKLTGIRANVSPSLSGLTESLSGSSTVKDFETMLQLNYLWFTHPRKDPEAFKSLIDKLSNTLKNFKANPQYVFMDSIMRMAYSDNPRAIIIPTEAQINAISLDKAYDIFTDRIRDASDFKFFFVGSFKIDEILPLLEAYIGGLPSEHRVESFRDVEPKLADKVIDEKMALNSEPQSMVIMFFHGKFSYNDPEELRFDMMMQTMNIKLREQMREEQGGVYGVSWTDNLSRIPEPEFQITANWGCAPEKVDTLTRTLFDEIKRVKKEGPADVDLAKVKETMIKEYETQLKQNGFWLGSLQDLYLNGNQIFSLDEYSKRVNAVTIQDLKETADKYLNENLYIRGVLMPKN